MAIVASGPYVGSAETRAIDATQSKLTVYVYKSGLFSGFADDHIIDAPIAKGTLSDTAPHRKIPYFPSFHEK